MIEKAKIFATKAHLGQTRKNSDVPYITHPIRVAERLEMAGCSKELIAAAYLHDAVEDTDVTLKDIQEAFGPRVAEIVAAHTEDKSKSWQERKQHTIDTLKNAEKDVKYLIIADKLDNILGLEKDLKEKGDAIWEKFNAGPEKQKWYNENIVKNMYVGLGEKDTPDYFREYEEAVKRVFG